MRPEGSCAVTPSTARVPVHFPAHPPGQRQAPKGRYLLRTLRTEIPPAPHAPSFGWPATASAAPRGRQHKTRPGGRLAREAQLHRLLPVSFPPHPRPTRSCPMDVRVARARSAAERFEDHPDSGPERCVEEQPQHHRPHREEGPCAEDDAACLRWRHRELHQPSVRNARMQGGEHAQAPRLQRVRPARLDRLHVAAVSALPRRRSGARGRTAGGGGCRSEEASKRMIGCQANDWMPLASPGGRRRSCRSLGRRRRL